MQPSGAASTARRAATAGRSDPVIRIESESDMNDTARPSIARIWRGRTPRERADEYAAYLYEAGIRPLEERALGVQQLREDRGDETEFVTISYWESIASMSSFAGDDDPTGIHHLERDAEFLVELPKTVQILDITWSYGNTGGTA